MNKVVSSVQSESTIEIDTFLVSVIAIAVLATALTEILPLAQPSPVEINSLSIVVFLGSACFSKYC